MSIKNIIINTIITTVMLNSTECNYKKLFGFAKVKMVKDDRAYVSFTVEDSFGREKTYKEPFIIATVDGIKSKKIYPAMLYISQSGDECQKYKIVLIQDIGTSCRVK